MLPSKIRPTTSLSRLTTGLPELPPMMSAVETKLSGVSRFEAAAFVGLDPARRQLRRGAVLPCALACSKAPPMVVYGGIELAVDLVALDGAEGQPQGEGGVGIDGVALDLEDRLGDHGVIRGFDPLDLVLLGLADRAGPRRRRPGPA